MNFDQPIPPKIEEKPPVLSFDERIAKLKASQAEYEDLAKERRGEGYGDGRIDGGTAAGIGDTIAELKSLKGMGFSAEQYESNPALKAVMDKIIGFQKELEGWQKKRTRDENEELYKTKMIAKYTNWLAEKKRELESMKTSV